MTSASDWETEKNAIVENDIIRAGLQGHKHLYLNYKNLHHIPPAIFTHCKYIQKLYLKRNVLESLPANISQLCNLVELYLHSNCLRMLPEEIGQMKSLVFLDVSNNDLSKLPATVGQLPHLQRLHASSNNLTSLPSTIGALKQLHTLQVADNELEQLPDDIGQCTSLRCLMVDSNRLLILPHSLHHCQMLEEIYLNANRLLLIPFNLMALVSQKLRAIYVDSNPLLQAIPLELISCVRGFGNGRVKGEMPNIVKLLQIVTTHGDVVNLPPQIRRVMEVSKCANPFTLQELSLRWISRRLKHMDITRLPKHFQEMLHRPTSWCMSCEQSNSVPMFLECYLAVGLVSPPSPSNHEPLLTVKMCCNFSCLTSLTSGTREGFQHVAWSLMANT